MVLTFSIPATAQDNKGTGGVFDLPAQSNNNDASEAAMTHPVLNLTPDKSELVNLEKEAASVIVGNPNHINVMLDTPNTLIVVPRASGASHFTVVGKDGSIIMQRHVIVGGGSNDGNYVRIRRSCGNNTGSRACEATSVYFCPDVCHEVSQNQQNTRR